MRNAVVVYCVFQKPRFFAYSILLLRECNHVIVWKMADRFPWLSENDFDMNKIFVINQLLNFVIAKYRDLSSYLFSRTYMRVAGGGGRG